MHSRHRYQTPDPTPPTPSSFSCVKSIPDDPWVLRPRLGKARSHTSLAHSVLVCPFLPSIYLSLLLSTVRFPMSHRSLPFICFSVSSSVPHLCPPLVYLSLFLS